MPECLYFYITSIPRTPLLPLLSLPLSSGFLTSTYLPSHHWQLNQIFTVNNHRQNLRRAHRFSIIFLQSCAQSYSPNIMSASSFLQLQTRAAHPPKRSQNQPDQHTQVTASSSSSTCDSSPRSSTESTPPQSPFIDFARCSRCHRSVSVDGSPPSMTGVSFGINSYYCQRCANLVGYTA